MTEHDEERREKGREQAREDRLTEAPLHDLLRAGDISEEIAVAREALGEARVLLEGALRRAEEVFEPPGAGEEAVLPP